MAESTPQAAANAPWRGTGELLWRRDRGRFVMCASGHDADTCLSDAEASCPRGIIEVPAPEPGFENLAGLDTLLGVLRDLLGPRFSLLRERHSDIIDLLTGPDHREQLSRLVPISEAAALGTTRRVSRESHTSALWIDQAARLVADAALLAAASEGHAVLRVDAVDLWDRPSVRILYRAAVVAAPGREVSVIGRLRHWHPLGECASLDVTANADDAGPLGVLRSGFLSAIAARPAVIVHTALAADRAEPPVLDLRGIAERALAQDDDTLLRLVGNSLSLQNFERAELLIQAGLATCAARPGGTVRPDEPETVAHLLRLSAISAAQVGHIDHAMEKLDQAVSVARSPELIAHLYYLLGLISTKRHYDLDTAGKYYQAARRSIALTSEPSTQGRVEMAWISNGIALAAAMKARGSADQATREKLYNKAFQEEFGAFSLVRDLPGMSAFYLRYNLGYNLAFLLQITGRYQAAERFLESLASVLLAGRPDYGALFKYTVGILQLKDADYDAAVASFRAAADLSLSLRDHFYAERMLVALAYTQHSRGAHREAAECYREGALLARWLGDGETYLNHLSGLLWSITLGNLDYPDDVREAAEAWLPDVAGAFAATSSPQQRIDALRQGQAVVEVPSSKLPSYIPAVDLEGTPKRDINRMLAGVSATELPARADVLPAPEVSDESSHDLVR
jgi:tetratricopeptide (TPR) repeat protein